MTEVGWTGEGETRTDMDCHNCDKVFVAILDFSINGKHVVECPHCGHEHCRVIKNGKITGERWSDRNGVVTKGKAVWSSTVIKAQTTVASLHIRDLWLRTTGSAL